MGEIDRESKEKSQWIIGSMVIIFVLVGLIELFFYFEIDEFQFFIFIYPTVSFLIGVISYFVFKNVWMGPALILGAGFLSIMLYGMAILVNVVIYSAIGLFGALVVKGLASLKNI